MILIGINYKDTPLHLREKFYFSEEEILELQKKNIIPKVILSTCNRTEIYFENLNKSDKTKLVKKVVAELCSYKGLSPTLLDDYFYIFYDEAAITHLYKVATSINSMIVGETQVLGQLKKAYQLARKEQLLSSYMNKVFHEAISIGKKARSETSISRGEVSFGTIAIDTVKNFFPYKRINLFIFGVGDVTKEVLKNLEKVKVGKIFILVRKKKPDYSILAKLEKIASKIEYVPLAKKLEFIRECDVIISASSSKEFILNSEEYKEITLHSFQLRLFIDLGVPRNIDPSITEVEDTILYSLDDLKEGMERNYQKRINEVKAVKKIIREQLEEFEKWKVKKTYLEIFSNVKKKIMDLATDSEAILVKLEKYRKDFPKDEEDLEKKINNLTTFLIKENIN